MAGGVDLGRPKPDEAALGAALNSLRRNLANEDPETWWTQPWYQKEVTAIGPVGDVSSQEMARLISHLVNTQTPSVETRSDPHPEMRIPGSHQQIPKGWVEYGAKWLPSEGLVHVYKWDRDYADNDPQLFKDLAETPPGQLPYHGWTHGLGEAAGLNSPRVPLPARTMMSQGDVESLLKKYQDNVGAAEPPVGPPTVESLDRRSQLENIKDIGADPEAGREGGLTRIRNLAPPSEAPEVIGVDEGSDTLLGGRGSDTMAKQRVWGAGSPRLTKLDILSGMDVGKTTPGFALPPGRKLGVTLGAGKVNDPDLVRQWQDFLKENGFMDKNERSDGSFGPNTRLATRLFQGINGIKQDGVVGDQTLAAMKQHLDLVNQPPPSDPNAPRKVKTETVVGVPDIAPNDLFPSEPDKTTLPDAVVPIPLQRPERTLSAEEMAGTTRRLPRMEPPQQGGGSGTLVVPAKADATPPLRLTSPNSAAAPKLGEEIAKIPLQVEVALPKPKLGDTAGAAQILMSDLRLGLDRPRSPLDADVQKTVSAGNFGREAAAMEATHPPPYGPTERGASPTGMAFGDSGHTATAGDTGSASGATRSVVIGSPSSGGGPDFGATFSPEPIPRTQMPSYSEGDVNVYSGFSDPNRIGETLSGLTP